MLSRAFLSKYQQNVEREMKKPKIKAPPKLSPQEGRVYDALAKARTFGCSVFYLYRTAREMSALAALKRRIKDRQMQQHVGVLVARLNKKRRRTMIVPGGGHNYILRRRRTR